MLTKDLELELFPLHPGQQHVLDSCSRFNVLCCGRRWGKSTMGHELLSSPDDDNNGFLNGFPVAYCAPTYKNMLEFWEEFVEIFRDLIKHKNEKDRVVKFHGGGRVDFWSLDKPEAIRGRKYKRVVCDEVAIVKNFKKIWTKILRPMLTDLVGDAFFLSTPQGKSNYFYDLFQFEKKHSKNWKSYQFPSASNPYLSLEEIEEARLELDPISFAQEYLASFVTENLSQWAYCYDEKKHVGVVTLDKRYEVYLSFDFNHNPITCFVSQHHNGIRGVEQIKLPTSNIYELCDYIKATYQECMFIVTGDATGQGTSALVEDQLNYYIIIKEKLRLASAQFKVPTVNPKVKENRVVVNAVLHNRDVLLDKEKCAGLIFDLEHASCLPNGDLDKTDRKDVTKQLDALDCFRYYLNAFHKKAIRA